MNFLTIYIDHLFKDMCFFSCAFLYNRKCEAISHHIKKLPCFVSRIKEVSIIINFVLKLPVVKMSCYIYSEIIFEASSGVSHTLNTAYFPFTFITAELSFVSSAGT